MKEEKGLGWRKVGGDGGYAWEPEDKKKTIQWFKRMILLIPFCFVVLRMLSFSRWLADQLVSPQNVQLHSVAFCIIFFCLVSVFQFALKAVVTKIPFFNDISGIEKN